ncbi:MAG: hypothetical protein IV104_13200 [Acidovorax sp.]|nr:hypothetical protein [Acidovorax sp.]
MSSTDPFVLALQRLCVKVGGHDKLASKIGASGQSIYQIVSERKLPSGNAKSVGPALRAKISQAYPDWLKDPVALIEPAAPSTTIAQALEVVAAALSASDDLTTDQVRPLLSRLVDEPGRASEIVPRLSKLLSSKPGAAMETAAFAGKPKSESTPSPVVTAGEFVKR